MNKLTKDLQKKCHDLISNILKLEIWTVTDTGKRLENRITLSMVLEAMNIKNLDVRCGGRNRWFQIRVYGQGLPIKAKWQLRKDNKWLTLEDQSEDFFHFVVEVLG